MDKITQKALNEIIHDFNEELTKNPEIADAYCARGMLKFCLKDVDGALSDWSTAVGLGSRNTVLLIQYLTLL